MALLLLLASLAAPSFEELARAYAGAVAEGDWGTARRVAMEIAALKDDRGPRLLQKEFEAAPSPEPKRLLFRAIASLDVPQLRAFLEPWLGAEDPYFRAASLEALVRLDPAAAARRAGELLEADDDRRVRRAAMEALAAIGGPEAARILVAEGARLGDDEKAALLGFVRSMAGPAIDALADLAADPDAERRLLALIAIASRGAGRHRPLLERAAKDPDRRVALVAAAGLDRLEPQRPSALAGIFQRAKSFDEKWDLLDVVALAGIRDEALSALLAKAARDGEKALRAKAAETLGHAGRKEAVPLLVPLLSAEKPWQLPVGAARGLAATRAREAVDPLIAALAKAQGRLRKEIASALESLTGQPFGGVASTWERWWRERGEGFEPPPAPPAPPAPFDEETAAADRYAFYGIEIASNAASFVCDVSGSMQGEKIETLRRELTSVVKRFPPSGRFQLVFFNENVQPFTKELVPATPKAKEKAVAAVAALQAAGATNLFDAMEAGLRDPAVDTLVLLTDGAPTAGKVRDMNGIRKRFLLANRERMVLLHVVCIGQKSPHLRDMARLSGGRYVEK